MREFAFRMFNGEYPGLRPQEKTWRAVRALETALNVRVLRTGYEGSVRPTSPFDESVVMDFPFPQLFEYQGGFHLLKRDEIASVDVSTVPWTPTDLPVTGLGTIGTEVQIQAGGLWHAAHLGEAFYYCNGLGIVFRPGMNVLSANPARVYYASYEINSIAHYRGRLVLGGFNNIAWPTALSVILNKWAADGGISDPATSLKRNTILWSSIGQEDLPLWLFYPDALPSDLDVSAELIIEKFKRNEMGFMDVPHSGAILAIKQLADKLVVYGENGVTMLEPLNGPNVATFGIERFWPVRIAGRDTVGGDEEMHLSIDTAGRLWKIDAENLIQQVGYRKYVEPMLDGNISILKVETEGMFYVSSKLEGFLLMPGGGSQLNFGTTAVIDYDGGIVGIASDNSNDEALLVSTPFDLTSASIKLITNFSVFGRWSEDTYIAVDYRYNQTEEWRRSPFKPLNKEGNVRLHAAGLEFRLVLKVEKHEDFQLDEVVVKWQKTDKRVSRGPDADSTAVGASE